MARAFYRQPSGTVSPKMQPTIAGPIFKEYLGYIEAERFMAQEGSIGKITKEDCLLVIDMQNDFISWHAEHNVNNSRFASSESHDIVDPIVELVQAFHENGGTVVATKDYHPWDHCSFIGCTDINFAPRKNQIFGESAGFPAHCVQGNDGANIYAPIRHKFRELMQKDMEEGEAQGLSKSEARANSKVQISFKGFHEAIDSFGGVEYPADSSLGRFKDVYKKSPCQLSCWTGACILKCSSMMGISGQIEAKDVDSPPDIMSLQFGNRPMPIHEHIRSRGCKRVFICGLVLDCCVIDTCLNAIDKGFETYMIIDATRPAHVQGFGAFGSGVALGLVNDPQPVKEWIEASNLQLVSTEGLLSKEAVERLKQIHDVPFIEKASKSAREHLRFPAEFSVLLQAADNVGTKLDLLEKPTAEKMGVYSVARLKEIRTLQHYGFKLEGKLSPLSPITLTNDEEKKAIDIPAGSASFAFAYAVDGAENIAKIRESSPHTLQCLTDANMFFAAFGGYVYFNAAGEKIGCTALTTSHHGKSRQLQPKDGWSDPELLKSLQAQGRLRPAILPDVVHAGAKAFAWVLPGEGVAKSEFGGFVYIFYDPEKPPADGGKALWFPF